MDLIQMALSRSGFHWGRFDGSMDMKKRGTAITEFKTPSSEPKIMIISLKAGGVGLNVSKNSPCGLTGADYCPSSLLRITSSSW
jgi:SNF2 family DNA or RNA helicase